MNKADIHQRICNSLNDLYRRKNADYGDSFGKQFEEYGIVSSAIRLEDKFNYLLVEIVGNIYENPELLEDPK